MIVKKNAFAAGLARLLVDVIAHRGSEADVEVIFNHTGRRVHIGHACRKATGQPVRHQGACDWLYH